AARPADRARPSTNNRLLTDVSSLRRGGLFMRSTKLRKWQGAIAERAGFPRTARRSVPTSLPPLLRAPGLPTFGVFESARTYRHEQALLPEADANCSSTPSQIRTRPRS